MKCIIGKQCKALAVFISPATRTTYWSLGLISSMFFFRVVLKSPRPFCSVSVKSVSSWSMNFSVLIKSSKSISRFLVSDFLASERISYVCRWKQNENNSGIAGIYIKMPLHVRQQLKCRSSDKFQSLVSPISHRCIMVANTRLGQLRRHIHSRFCLLSHKLEVCKSAV